MFKFGFKLEKKYAKLIFNENPDINFHFFLKI